MRYVWMLLLACATAFASEIKVTGTVVDGDGKAVANADVSAWWSHWKGTLAPDGGVKSGKDGTFTLDVEPEGSVPPTLLAYDADRKNAAVLTLGKEAAQKVTLKLLPACAVKVRFECPDMGIPFASTIEGVMRVQPSGSPFMQCGSATQDAMLLLPAGLYAFDNASTDTLAREYPFEVPALTKELDLGTVNLDPTPISRQYGKPPLPLAISSVRDGPADLTLEKLKGKHVLVIFWALWCTPCITGTLPDAIAFYEKHPELRNKFEIVGVHEPGVKSWEEYDAKAKTVIEKYWKGKTTKFPMLLDKNAFKDYHIKLMPTEMLIGPDGNVLPHGSLENLKKALGVKD